MEELEPPECPVCLIPYDAVSTVPRVLPCGHTTCELCLKQLQNPFPNTIRCTVCTLLVKLPNCLSNLPKNIDLLHFSLTLQRQELKGNKDKKGILVGNEEKKESFLLVPNSWSYEFYRKWKRWILGKDCVLVKEIGFSEVLGSDHELGFGKDCVLDGKKGVLDSDHKLDFEKDCVLDENMGVGKVCKFVGSDEMLGLVKVGNFVKDEGKFEFSYESKIVSVLFRIDEKKLEELSFVLNAVSRVGNVGEVYGFWCDENDDCVYLVCEKFGSRNLTSFLQKRVEDERKSLSNDEMRGLAMLGMDMCEVISSLHCQGMVIGCLGLSCFSFNGFGRVCVDMCEVFDMRKRVDVAIRKGREDLEGSSKNDIADESSVFVSPEMVVQYVIRGGLDVDKAETRYEVGCASDVWSLACLLVELVIGSSYQEVIDALVHYDLSDKDDSEGSSSYTSWMRDIVLLLEDKLGTEFGSLQEILSKCLDFNPTIRPPITVLWKSLRELVIKPQFDIAGSNKNAIKNSDKCMVLGELFPTFNESNRVFLNGLLSEDDTGKLRVDGDVIEGVSKGRVKCVELKGHLDCITGLAIGGGFLFSCSYDKIVHVWSLQDLTLLGSFKGHDHRITAVVYVDGEQPLCISADNDGAICIWEVGFPFSDVPVMKLHEQKDWRYSGIHAMAISGTEFLYTGSGDTLVKAWSLKDYTLSYSMSGHKSVVSALEICNGVLYSGSWDGTIRLWSLSDHSPLAVLGEDKIGRVSSILSLSAENNLLVVGQENGCIKMWHNDILWKSKETHKGAVFSVIKNGKWLLSGGWDKSINVQEISEDVDGADVTPVCSLACDSTITALLYREGKLFIGQANRVIKVYSGI